MNQVKRMIPNMLEEYNLIINQDKTEMYKISRTGWPPVLEILEILEMS